MRNFLINLFSSDAKGPEIALFNLGHILYVVLILGAIFLTAYLIKDKSDETKLKVVNFYLISAMILYILDFFIMPLYRKNIDIDKLPFHICTLICIVACFGQFNKKFSFVKQSSIVLCIVGPLMYLCYPGSAIGDISAFSYKVIQTFLYHGLVLGYGILSLTTKQIELKFKNIWKELVALVFIAIWATLGNNIYSSSEHHYDWFFLTGSTFPFIPKPLMPFVVITAIFGMVALIYGIYYLVKYLLKKYKEKK